jgi:hypothetical protein
MADHTELEEKLFKYIQFLISVINIYDQMMMGLHKQVDRIFGWGNNEFVHIDRMNGYKNMIDDLNKEFNWGLKIITPDKEEEVL